MAIIVGCLLSSDIHPHFQSNISLKSVGHFDQISLEASSGWGERLLKVFRLIGLEL